MALGSGSQGVKKLLSERGTRSSLMLQVQVPVVVPSFFVCPISLELMRDPVTLCTGITYDRASIQKWLGFGHNRCPATNQILATEELIPNHTLRRLIQNWCVANKANGVERIPTPKAPVEFDAVKELLHYIAQCNSTETSSMATPLKQLRSLAQECERNRKRIAEAGAVAILAAALAKLRTDMDMDIDRNRSWEVEACEDALATIVVVLHLSNGDGGKKAMSEPKTLWCLSFVLQSGSVEARANAADVIYRVCEEDPRVKVAVGDLPGAIQGLVELLAEDGYPRAVEAGLRSLLSVCLPRRNRAIAVACSSISVLVALLPASEKRHKELAFALLEVLANCAEGREAISNHALALPVIVKSMLGVSPRATEHAVAALWVVLSYASNRSVVTRALQAGACANLLLLLPSECSLRVKHKARDSLKLLSEVGGSCLPCRSPLDHSTVAKHRHRAHVS